MRIYAVYTGYSLTQFVIICYIIAKKKESESDSNCISRGKAERGY